MTSEDYKQMDLGYPRVVTTAQYEVEMSDGSRWRVPVQCIADSRDEYYRDDKEDTIGSIRDGLLDDSEIQDWAGNNMNWSDVKDFAVRAEIPQKKVDWEDGWSNGFQRIVGKIWRSNEA